MTGMYVVTYVYHDFGSKVIQKGFNSLNSDNKSVRQYKILPVPFVISHKYFQKILNEAIGVQIIFYLTKVAILSSNSGKPWFTKILM